MRQKKYVLVSIPAICFLMIFLPTAGYIKSYIDILNVDIGYEIYGGTPVLEF